MPDLKPPALDPASLPVQKGSDYPEPFKTGSVFGSSAGGLRLFKTNSLPTIRDAI